MSQATLIDLPTPHSILFVGNPGVGKSSLLNLLARKSRQFTAGYRAGHGQTQQVHYEALSDSVTLVDLPGMFELGQVENNFKVLSKAVNESLQTKTLFIIRLEAGRVVHEDLALVQSFIQSSKNLKEIGIVINKCGIKDMKLENQKIIAAAIHKDILESMHSVCHDQWSRAQYERHQRDQRELLLKQVVKDQQQPQQRSHVQLQDQAVPILPPPKVESPSTTAAIGTTENSPTPEVGPAAGGGLSIKFIFLPRGPNECVEEARGQDLIEFVQLFTPSPVRLENLYESHLKRFARYVLGLR